MIKGIKEDRKHNEKTEEPGKERFLNYCNSLLEMRVIMIEMNLLNN